MPAIKEGFLPDSISTDLHIGSMNAGMKDMLNVMSKFLALGMSLDDVIAPLHLESGARDQAGGARPPVGGRRRRTSPCCGSRRATSASSTCTARGCAATERLTCEMTLRDGKVVYDLNGLARPDWTTLPKDYRTTGDPRGTRTRR